VIPRSTFADAYAACEALARSHYENFPVASRLLPAAMRPHIAAIYAYARVADDLADEGNMPAEQRLVQLAAWQRRLHAALADERQTDPARSAASTESNDSDNSDRATVRRGPNAHEDLIIVATAHTIRSFDLPVSLFDDLVSAFGQDTTTTRYDSWADVLDYCRRSANPVGRLVLRVAGIRSDTLDASSDALCTALQLTNFWQDFGRDWHAGRLYVPREVYAATGAAEEQLRESAPGEPWGRALDECVRVTGDCFARGRAVCDAVRGRLRYELRVTWLGGRRVLERVHQRRERVFMERPALGAGDLPSLAWRALLWNRWS
jgi:hydroxysqualene synthase